MRNLLSKSLLTAFLLATPVAHLAADPLEETASPIIHTFNVQILDDQGNMLTTADVGVSSTSPQEVRVIRDVAYQKSCTTRKSQFFFIPDRRNCEEDTVWEGVKIGLSISEEGRLNLNVEHRSGLKMETFATPEGNVIELPHFKTRSFGEHLEVTGLVSRTFNMEGGGSVAVTRLSR